MEGYITKANPISGTDFKEVHKRAYRFYNSLRKRTKRRPYIRSAYFDGQKIFLDLFWHHMYQKKNFRDLMRRLKLLPCAIELLRESRHRPTSKINPNRKSEILHRFAGITPHDQNFAVQIKENRRTTEKTFMSVFPTS